MSYAIGIPLMALLAILQSSLISHLGLLDGRPDLVLLAIIGWALTGRSTEAMVLGFFGGLFLDLMSSVPLGVSSVALVLVAAVVSYSEGQFWGINPMMQLAATLVGSLIYYLIGLGVLVISGRSFELSVIVGRVLLPSLFLNLVLALPAIQLVESLRGSIAPREVTV